MSPMGDKITSERAARELGKAEPGNRAGVVKAMIEAAPVAKCNLQVTSLNQARELARIEPRQRDEEKCSQL